MSLGACISYSVLACCIEGSSTLPIPFCFSGDMTSAVAAALTGASFAALFFVLVFGRSGASWATTSWFSSAAAMLLEAAFLSGSLFVLVLCSELVFVFPSLDLLLDLTDEDFSFTGARDVDFFSSPFSASVAFLDLDRLLSDSVAGFFDVLVGSFFLAPPSFLSDLLGTAGFSPARTLFTASFESSFFEAAFASS
uniref:Uncharacterized protein n=1 Tax=Ixodes ricinus TaxID=34613 RepID=A0A147BLS6_IXORI